MNRRSLLRLAGPALALAAAPVRAQTLTAVRVGASPDDGLWPLLYALKSGLFQKNGLDVQLSPIANGAAAAAAVVGGAIDIGKTSLMALVTAHQRGIPFKLIVGAATHEAGDHSSELLVLKDSPLTSIGQANGKTIAVVVLQSLDQYGISSLIDQHGGDSSTVKFVELPYAAMQAALEQGRADVASIGNPSLGPALQSGKFRTLGVPFDGVAPRFLIGGWFCMQRYVTANHPTIERFTAAMREATAYTNQHLADIIPMIAAYTKIDPERLRSQPHAPNTVVPDAQLVAPTIAIAVKYKLIDRGFPATDLIAS